MKKIGLFFILLMLVGCAQKQDVLFYAKHPQALRQVLLECNTTNSLVASSEKCRRAMSIYKQLVALQLQSTTEPQQLGKSIIADEIAIAHLKQKLKQLNTKQQEKILSRKLANLQKTLQIKLYFAASAIGMAP
ncbi:MAG: EexN family lipoprotein [Pseudomonadota bacterium]